MSYRRSRHIGDSVHGVQVEEIPERKSHTLSLLLCYKYVIQQTISNLAHVKITSHFCDIIQHCFYIKNQIRDITKPKPVR